ncbi:uncharacterized protein LOC121242227 [Juglans microcarpa x Juglans regia]|uniref:uncharacterized protein LOC121242227 n=1 Tax=Juglans microcarpa x Juglans regia TaxID=2249226 RepID=UPI001B7F377C|nr:uncharacterized protein LOC121242227 [Juglans microcarpa x Juglans regia]
MTEDITQRWESLKLTEEEQEQLTLPEEALLSSNTKGKHCLLAMIFNDRTANMEAFKSTMSKAWNTKGWITFKEFGTNKFLLDFQCLLYKNKVMNRRLWSFDRYLVCMKEFEGGLSPLEVQFTHEPFWIQVHNLPFAGMTKEVGALVGSGLGRVLEVEVDTKEYG